MIFGLIIAAGKQTRFKKQIPKCLATLNNKCILDTTIENLSSFCDKIFVVCSKESEEYFNNYNYISIESGFGSGDAILKAINYLINNYKINSNDSVIIQWGDALVNKQLYSKLDFENKVTIPCIIEEKPYVQLIKEDKVRVKFSKYNEKITPGYHDLCVFSCNILYLLKYLNEFFVKFYFNSQYNHKHGNEFEFLDIFNDTECDANIVIVDNSFTTKSFNTIDELSSLGGLI